MTAADAVPSMLPAALWWVRLGHPIFPLWWPDSGHCACPLGVDCESAAKHPLTEHGWKDATTDEDTVRRWWTRWPSANIGVPTGVDFDAVDIDGGAQAWAALTEQHGTPEHRAVVMSGRHNGGFHLYCFPGGQKTIPQGKRGLPMGVEIKGVGGYVVAPPSVHVSGRAYTWLKHLEDGVVLGDTGYPDWYGRVTARPDRSAPPAIASLAPDADRAQRYGQAVLRRACDLMAQATDGTRWNTLVFEAAPMVARAAAGGCLDRAAGIEALEAAARSAGLDEAESSRVAELVERLESEGITDPISLPAEDPSVSVDAWLAGLPTAETSAGYAAAAARERTSWWPRDLAPVLSGVDPEPQPTVLGREDGPRLLYPGKVNGLIGESESGKTWVALLAVLQTIATGQPVTYLDFEDTAAGIVTRLRLMGASDAQLGLLSYIGPDEALHAAASADLSEALHHTAPDLIVLDGFNAAMTLLGLDLNSNTDATKFAQKLLRPLAVTGACVTYVDHVPKNREARGKGGIGAQAKRAMTTGCALAVEVAEPFGRGMRGRLRLTVDKDRPGHVRAVSGGARYAGEAVLRSQEDGRVEVSIHGPDLRPPEERGPWRPTGYMEKVSRFLATMPGGASQTQVEKGVGGTADHVRQALTVLVEEGYVRRDRGPRNAMLHVLDRDYSEVDDMSSGDL